MGENKRNYYDPDVCRLFLAGLCPHDLLLSTQMDIGLCSKVHSLQLRKDSEETNPKGSESFGRELEYVIGRLIALCDRKGQGALKKLTDEDAKAATAISVSEVTLTKDVLQLSEEINEKTKEVHTSDFEGRTDEHIMAQKVVDELRAKRADMQATLFLHALNKDRSSLPQPAPPLQVAAVLPPDARTKEMINEKLTKAPGKQGMVDVALKALEEAEALEKPEPSSVLSKCTAADVRTADRKLRFCDICGTIFSVHENFRLFSEHFGGKLHLGFMLIREKQKELQEQSKRRKDECEGSLVNERDMDFISNLSDDLLGLIITRLDIHEGARTTILSHRWKSLWQKAPLNFDDKYIKAGSTRERISIVVQVFNKHRGSFRRVIFHHAPFKPLCHWCEVGMFNNLDQISLDLNYENLPECVQCLPLVRSVCLNRCVIKANSYFRSKKLALLELRYCRGAGKFFTFMFSQSENTETLMLVQNFGHHTLRFHSIMPRLRRLFVVVDPHMFLNYNDDDDDDEDDDC